jgi:integrase
VASITRRTSSSKPGTCTAPTLHASSASPRRYGRQAPRDKRVKLPKQRKPHVPPPLVEHVERVAETVPKHYILPLLIIDECGPRVRELETAQVGDLDEHCRAIRVRWTVENNEPWRPDSDRGGPDAPGRSHLPRRRGRAARAGR